jgi:hypothetical protein
MAHKGPDQAIRDAAEKLEAPDWVPGPVAELARIMYRHLIADGADSGSIKLLRRLTCDPRMKRVWNELLRHKRVNYRTTGHFLHPARSGPKIFWTREARTRLRRADLIRILDKEERIAKIEPLEASALLAEFAEITGLFSRYGGRHPENSRQQNALAFLFHEAFTLAQQKPRPVSQTEAQAARSYFLAMAKRILADEIQQRRLGRPPEERLSRAASAYVELADTVAPASGSPLLVMRRHGHNESVKGFVMEFASTTKEIFGAPLFGTVATFANVALDRDDLTGEKVRKMLL